MTDQPKPNNCIIYFECMQPKKCVHYKRAKKYLKPCKSCKIKDCQTNYLSEYCHKLEAWKENQSMCQHNQGTVGRCYNTIAQMQAITKIYKKMGVKFKLEGDCKDCQTLDHCNICARYERKDYYTPKE